MTPFIVAVDFGGTQIRAALCDSQGQIYRRIAQPTGAAAGPEAVIGRLLGAIDEVMTGAPNDQVAGLGIAAPGPLNPATGVILSPPNLPGWTNIPLRGLLSQRLGRPVFLNNDANLAGLGENTFGAGRGVRDMIYLTISTGVGSGIIVDGRMIQGVNGLGAEAGHMIIEPDGPLCNCGHHGCLEAFSSGAGIARHAVERIKAGKKTRITKMVGGDLSKVTARVVNEAAQLGDKVGTQALRRAGRYLGIGIANLLRIFNPRMIVLGGSVMKAGSLLTEPMWDALRDAAPRIYWEGLTIVPAALGDDAGLLGCVALVTAELHLPGPADRLSSNQPTD